MAATTHLTRYQVLLLDVPRIKSSPSAVLNPESPLPGPEEQPVHACARVIDHLQYGQLDLWDQPLGKADVTLFTYGGSYVQDSFRHAGEAVVPLTEVIWYNLCLKGHQPPR